jgi:hypothetical protein
MLQSGLTAQSLSPIVRKVRKILAVKITSSLMPVWHAYRDLFAVVQKARKPEWSREQLVDALKQDAKNKNYPKCTYSKRATEYWESAPKEGSRSSTPQEYRVIHLHEWLSQQIADAGKTANYARHLAAIAPPPLSATSEAKLQASKDTLPICDSPTPSALAEAGVFAIRQTLHCILTEFEEDPEMAVREKLDIKTDKQAIAIDVVADSEFANCLRSYDNERFKSIEITGEERFSEETASFAHRPGTFVLVDPLDGSDLAERGLSNWCSAAVFFEPSRSADRIRAAVVGIPPNHVYFATADDPQVRVYRYLPKLNGITLAKTNYKPQPVTGLPPARLLPNASIYFYGQKVKNFVTVAQRPLWHKLRNDTYKNLRVFNLGGIPMLVRMCDHQVKQARGVDAVIELKGQKPHDAVPGLFFAVKAGATVLSLAVHDFGSPLTLPKLEQLLFDPTTPAVKYLAATSQQLADELLPELKP